MRAAAISLAAVVFVADCVLGLTPLGNWAFQELLGTTARVADQAQTVMLCVAPIPLFLAWRGLRTALALRARRTQILTQSTFVRLLVLSLVLLASRLRAEPVAADAGLALCLGIAAETLWLHRQSRSQRAELSASGPPLDSRRLGAFAIPLVVSGWAWTAQRPIIQAILGRTGDSEAAQAAFGVLHPLLLLVASALWALQATGQIHGRERAEARRFVAFAGRTILLAAGIIIALGWLPPLRDLLIGKVFPVADELGEYLVPGLRLLFLASVFLGIRTTAKGLILASRSTRVILPASLGYLALLAILGAWVVHEQPAINGGVLAVTLIACVEMAAGG
jgi:Na+-driven multidrug efflux pump